MILRLTQEPAMPSADANEPIMPFADASERPFADAGERPFADTNAMPFADASETQNLASLHVHVLRVLHVQTIGIVSVIDPFGGVVGDVNTNPIQFIVIPNYPVIVSWLPGKFQLHNGSLFLHAYFKSPNDGCQVLTLWPKRIGFPVLTRIVGFTNPQDSVQMIGHYLKCVKYNEGKMERYSIPAVDGHLTD